MEWGINSADGEKRKNSRYVSDLEENCMLEVREKKKTKIKKPNTFAPTSSLSWLPLEKTMGIVSSNSNTVSAPNVTEIKKRKK